MAQSQSINTYITVLTIPYNFKFINSIKRKRVEKPKMIFSLENAKILNKNA